MLLHARLAEPVPAETVAERLAGTVARYPHLGAEPAVLDCPPQALAGVTARFADEPFEDRQPLLRVAIAPGELLLAVHHGATDGLGLLSVLGDALGRPVTSAARGIGDRRAATSFAAGAARRLAEALFAPPARIAPSAANQDAAGPGDVLVSRHLPAMRAGTAELVAATARAARRWNHERGTHSRRTVAGVGVSRRDGLRLSPVADTAFMRLRLAGEPDAAAVRRLLADQPPEPDVPRSAVATPRLPVRLLAGRLGATFLASNLGAVRAAGLLSLAFHPTASGRSGIAVGAATTASTSTITVRARRAAFDEPAAQLFLDELITHLSP